MRTTPDPDDKAAMVLWLIENDPSPDTVISAEYPVEVLRDRVAEVIKNRTGSGT